MKSFVALLVTMLIIFSKQQTFSMTDMIKYLISTGKYDIILNIKLFFSDDIAILSCEELIRDYSSIVV